MHEYSVQPQSHVTSLTHPSSKARIPPRQHEAKNVVTMNSSTSQEPRVDGLPHLTPSSNPLETLWLDLTVEVPKQWFLDVVSAHHLKPAYVVHSSVAPLTLAIPLSASPSVHSHSSHPSRRPNLSAQRYIDRTALPAPRTRTCDPRPPPNPRPGHTRDAAALVYAMRVARAIRGV